MTSRTQEFSVCKAGLRLDQFLGSCCPDMTRSRLANLIRGGLAMVNSLPAKPSQKVRLGDIVTLTIPPPTRLGLEPEDIPINILYEDADLMVIDKPWGLTVHPAPGHQSHTLVNGLLALRSNFSGIGGVQRPGIVHRLDKDTSGLMLVAKNDAAHHSLAMQLQKRIIHKHYLALVWGKPNPATGVIEAAIARDLRNRKRMAVVPQGRASVTNYETVEVFPEVSLVEVRPVTGRTHQIRIHLTSIGHPLVGDTLYSNKKTDLVERQFLHAEKLAFELPSTGEVLEVSSPLPSDLQRALDFLRKIVFDTNS
ncbi:MAG: RluA family pseudouridine synthase [Chloroflexota bacterium]|nr:RluA family pseudouridine synthase [Chloroflexota bacterium]